MVFIQEQKLKQAETLFIHVYGFNPMCNRWISNSKHANIFHGLPVIATKNN